MAKEKPTPLEGTTGETEPETGTGAPHEFRSVPESAKRPPNGAPAPEKKREWKIEIRGDDDKVLSIRVTGGILSKPEEAVFTVLSQVKMAFDQAAQAQGRRAMIGAMGAPPPPRPG